MCAGDGESPSHLFRTMYLNGYMDSVSDHNYPVRAHSDAAAVVEIFPQSSDTVLHTPVTDDLTGRINTEKLTSIDSSGPVRLQAQQVCCMVGFRRRPLACFG